MASIGDITVEGQTFYHPDGVKRLIAPAVSEIWTPWYGATKQNPFFLMWTDSKASLRWSGWNYGNPTAGTRQENIVPVTYEQRSDIWRAVDASGTGFFFTPKETDCIVGRGFKVTDVGGIDSLSSFIAANSGLPEDYATNSKTFAQNGPSGPLQGTGADLLKEGDFWIELDRDNALHRWSGSSWVELRDGRITEALDAASAAESAADGKTTVYRQATFPITATDGDILFNTSEGNKQYVWSSNSWIDAQDTEIGDAIADAAAAALLADGKIDIFYSTTAPANPNDGDLWYNENTKELKSWVTIGSYWNVVSTKGSTWDDVSGEGKPQSYVSHSGENMIADHDFNLLRDGKKTWTASASTQTPPVDKSFISTALVGTYGESSSNGVRLLSSGTDAYLQTTEAIACGPKRRYRLNFRVNSTVSGGSGAIAIATFFTSSGASYSIFSAAIYNTSGWKWITQIIEVPDIADITSMTVSFVNQGTSGNFDISEVGLVRQYMTLYKYSFASQTQNVSVPLVASNAFLTLEGGNQLDSQALELEAGRALKMSATCSFDMTLDDVSGVDANKAYIAARLVGTVPKWVIIATTDIDDSGARDGVNMAGGVDIITESAYSSIEIHLFSEVDIAPASYSGARVSTFDITDFEFVTTQGDDVEST